MNPLDQRWQMVRDRWPIRVKNGSGETIPPFSVLRITSCTFTNNEKVYTVAKPNTTFYRRYLVSGPFAIGSGSSDEGLAGYLSEGGPVQCDATPAIDESWGPKSGQWSLAKWRYGFTIDGGSTTFNSTTVALAVQHQVNLIYGQTQGAISKGNAGTIEVFDGNNTIITSTTVSATNRFANVADDKKVLCNWIGGTWLLSAAEC